MDGRDQFTNEMMQLLASFERQQIADRISRGLRDKVRNGGWPGGRVPLGYVVTSDSRLIEGAGSDAVRRIFDLAVTTSLRAPAIARVVSEEGETDVTGATVRSVLGKLTYTGDLLYGGELFRDHHVSLVAGSVWRQAQHRKR